MPNRLAHLLLGVWHRHDGGPHRRYQRTVDLIDRAKGVPGLAHRIVDVFVAGQPDEDIDALHGRKRGDEVVLGDGQRARQVDDHPADVRERCRPGGGRLGGGLRQVVLVVEVGGTNAEVTVERDDVGGSVIDRGQRIERRVGSARKVAERCLEAALG